MKTRDKIYSLWESYAEMIDFLGAGKEGGYKWHKRAPYIPPHKYDVQVIERAKDKGVDLTFEEIARHRASFKQAAA